jgi:phytoene dehydrogenase-like protein
VTGYAFGMHPAAAPDAVVVGSGPNGLSAAITIARAGRSVAVYEAADEPGGGCRTAELTLPGYRHDVCSAIHPSALASPFFRSLDLAARGLQFIHPDVPVAHPLDGGRAGILHRSVKVTAAGLGADGRAWQRTYGRIVEETDRLIPELLGPIIHLPRHPLALARFGLPALRSAAGFARSRFSTDEAQGLFAGMAGHSMLPLEAKLSASFGLVFGLFAHGVGWPMVKGGSGALAEALVAELRSLGGEILTGRRITNFDELPVAKATIFDTSPRAMLEICGDRLPAGYRRRVERYRYGPGIFKVDWALSEPIPWTNDAVRGAGTVHVGGTLGEIAAAEAEVNAGRHAERPFILVVQQSQFDPTRAPAGRHTAWAYCHVPSGSTVDMTAPIEAQVERFAPGFGDIVLARATRTAPEVAAYDENYVGGDINVGIADWRQLIFRPVPSLNPYATPTKGIYLASSATPPGGGVHGMCGHRAALSALRREFR